MRQAVVHAPSEMTFAAIQRADLMDPVVRLLFSLRELPLRIGAWMRLQRPPSRAPSVTFADLVGPGTGMAVAGLEPGHEIVVGSIGRFWEKDYGPRAITPEQEAALRTPGFQDAYARGVADGIAEYFRSYGRR